MGIKSTNEHFSLWILTGFGRGMLYQLSYVLIPWIRMPAIPHGWFSILSFKGMIFATMLPTGILFYASIKKYGYHGPWVNVL